MDKMFVFWMIFCGIVAGVVTGVAIWGFIELVTWVTEQ